MKTAAAYRADVPCGVCRAVTGVPLVVRLHVDLCRCLSAACRA
ncbi:hypothetical protein [Streptomyces kebangsaanensis]|uniref:Uncharacterized protein n=1 Tax=Streptomyces kebangsaanensis TaxID=864058 RepID=A0ABW6L3A0_9ACTN|nr:hypothetical protein [Streptomyces kebangsaanensis]